MDAALSEEDSLQREREKAKVDPTEEKKSTQRTNPKRGRQEKELNEVKKTDVRRIVSKGKLRKS